MCNEGNTPFVQPAPTSTNLSVSAIESNGHTNNENTTSTSEVVEPEESARIQQSSVLVAEESQTDNDISVQGAINVRIDKYFIYEFRISLPKFPDSLNFFPCLGSSCVSPNYTRWQVRFISLQKRRYLASTLPQPTGANHRCPREGNGVQKPSRRGKVIALRVCLY